MQLLVADERIGDIAESSLNRLPVSEQGLLMLRFSQVQIPAQGPSRENRLGDLGTVRPDAVLRTHEARESATPTERTAARPSQRNLRKECRLRDPDFGVSGYQVLFRFANIRPPLDDGGRQARRYFRRKRLRHQGKPSRHTLRVIAEQNTDGVFLLGDLPFQIRNGRIGSVENLLRL